MINLTFTSFSRCPLIVIYTVKYHVDQLAMRFVLMGDYQRLRFALIDAISVSIFTIIGVAQSSALDVVIRWDINTITRV